MLRGVSEAAWTTQVVEIARKTGWLCHHSRPSQTKRGRWVTAISGAPGLPDLILVKGGRVIFAELKRQHGGVISEAQQEWLVELGKCPGVETYVWTPGNADYVFLTLSQDQKNLTPNTTAVRSVDPSGGGLRGA